MTLPTKVLSDSLGQIGSLKRASDKSLFPMALGSCDHRITHQLRPINMNGRAILSVMSELRFAFDIPYAAMNETSSNRWNLSVISDFSGLANQVATSGHFAPRPTPHAPRPTPHAPRPTPHAPRSTFAGVRPPLPRRAGYPWTEQMDRKMLRNVEIRGVHAAENGPSSDRKYWQRLELGIRGLNR